MIERTWRETLTRLLLLDSERSSAARQGLQRVLLLRTLVTLTSLAAAGLFAALALPDMPLALIVTMPFVVLLSVMFGLWRLKTSQFISERELFGHLILDVIFLVVVLVYGGGIINPLISYLLVLLAVASTLLHQSYVNIYALVTIAAYTLFLVADLRSEADHMEGANSFQLHLVGMWVTFVVSAVLITVFITRMAATIRQRELTLAEARENEMRNEQLVAIGTLAAGTAHALGTPLSTMAVLLTELDRESPESLRRDSLKSDISLLREQVMRCKHSLNSLTRFYNKADKTPDTVPLRGFCDDIRDYIVNVHPGAVIAFELPPEFEDIAISSDPALKHALINIIENAVKASESRVHVTLTMQPGHHRPLSIAVQDDGPGIPPEVMENMGEPFISTRKDSMGLGIFLANAAIQRFGGAIEMFNLKSGGAMTLIHLPLTGTGKEQ